MRYICLQAIVTKVFDRILNDEQDIQNVLEQLKRKEITCSVQINNGPIHEVARILSFNKTSVTWKIIQKNSSLRITSKIDDISLLKVCTNEELMIKLKPKPSRWSSLDMSKNQDIE